MPTSTITTVSASTISVTTSGGAFVFADSANGFGGFSVGDTISVGGFDNPSNNGTFTIASASAGAINVGVALVAEAAGNQIIISNAQVTVEETPDSRAGTMANTDSKQDRKYIAKGSADDVAIRTAVLAYCPASIPAGLVRGPVDIDPIRDTIDELNPAKCCWNVTVHYVPSTSPKAQIDGGTYNFDTGGGTQHIIASKGTVGAYGTGTATTDNGNLIGVTKDNVEGVDVTVPVFQFSYTHSFSNAVVTDAYKGVLYNLTGKVNNGTFHGCAAGECLFLGASGSKKSGEKWEITFKFAASPNKTGLTIGDIGGIAKKGWEYLWVRYSPKVVNKMMSQKPVAVYVETVYDSGDFSTLGIGT